MRLINVETFEIKQSYRNIPPYAIISHTWGEEEVTYQEWVSWLTSKDEELTRRKGFEKIMRACQQTVKDGLHWLWVDTNCIDKTDSTELSEAINSMFAWYRDSEVCYAYLADVNGDPSPTAEYPETQSFQADFMAEFCRSKWFTRGWTLQELLAPREVIFYSSNWMRLGCKTGGGGAISNPLLDTLSSITSIPRHFLSGGTHVHDASSALKMSWLSKRETTRVEDIAYCALGIFDINMPLLYGEGQKAFTRLQEEIIRSRHDHTIFCWHWNEYVPSTWTSILAPSPSAFQDSAGYIIANTDDVAPYSVANIGLSISLPVVHTLKGAFAVLDATTLTPYRNMARGEEHIMPEDDSEDEAEYEYEYPRYRTCIHLRQHQQLARIFQRVMYTRKPVLIEHNWTPIWLWSGKPLFPSRPAIYHSLFVGIDQAQSPTNSLSPTTKFGVLLSFHPELHHLFTADNYYFNTNQNSTSNQSSEPACYYINTTPSNCFYEDRNILAIPQTQNPDELLFAVLLSFHASNRRSFGAKYHLFFMVDANESKVRWHCQIWSEKDQITTFDPHSQEGCDWGDEQAVFRTCENRGRDYFRYCKQKIGSSHTEYVSTADNIQMLLLARGRRSIAPSVDDLEVREAFICPSRWARERL